VTGTGGGGVRGQGGVREGHGDKGGFGGDVGYKGMWEQERGLGARGMWGQRGTWRGMGPRATMALSPAVSPDTG